MDFTLSARIKNILFLIGAILLALSVFKVTQSHYESRLVEKMNDLRVEKIKNSELKEVAEGHYQKLVADTLEIRELRRLTDSLKIKADTPIIVERIVIRPIEIEKPVDEVEIVNSSVEIVDYYPNKQNPFLRYSATINLLTDKSSGKFTFYNIPISLVVSENKDGTFTTDLKAPSFIQIEDFHVQSQPLKRPEEDNFGWLAGAGYVNQISTGRKGIEFMAGVRIKKLYLLTSLQDNSTFGINILKEF